MNERIITKENLKDYIMYLRTEERSTGTVENYLRHTRLFVCWAAGHPVTKEMTAAWKESLLEDGYAPVSVNAMLAALNGFLGFLGWNDCRVKFLKIQRRLFRSPDRELTRQEYDRLISTARAEKKERLVLLMETICATGIRVSEVRYITVEAALQGRTEISLKGKIRTILIPKKLCRKLLKYAKNKKIASGEVFLTENKKSISRRQIWGGNEASLFVRRCRAIQSVSAQPAASCDSFRCLKGTALIKERNSDIRRTGNPTGGMMG